MMEKVNLRRIFPLFFSRMLKPWIRPFCHEEVASVPCSLPSLPPFVDILYPYTHENLIQVDFLHATLIYLVQIMLKTVLKEWVIE